MAYPQSVPAVQLPAPVLGLNAKDPLTLMDPLYAPWIWNCEPENQYCRVRNGWSIHATLVDETVITGLGAFHGKLYAYGYKAGQVNRIFDVTAGGTIRDEAAVHVATKESTALSFTSYLSNRMVFGSTIDNARVFDGTTWSAWGFTYNPGTGAVSVSMDAITTFRGRPYIFSGLYMYYADTLGAVTGATTRVDLSQLLEEAQTVRWAARLTTPSMLDSEMMLAAGYDSGEILIWAGDSPASDNWQLVSKLKTAPCMFRGAVLEYNNDVYIMTGVGLLSLRALLGSPSKNTEEASVTNKVDPYWTKLIRRIKEQPGANEQFSCASIAYVPDRNKIVCHIRGRISYDGTYSNAGTIFVIDTQSGGVVPQSARRNSLPYSARLTYLSGNLYMVYNNNVLKYDLASYVDEIGGGETALIDYAIEGAHTNLGSPNKYKDVIGFEPIMKTDFPQANVTMKCSTDFGRETTEAVTAELQDGFNNPTYATGGRGTYVQYKIEGNADPNSEDGLELYSVGAIIK